MLNHCEDVKPRGLIQILVTLSSKPAHMTRFKIIKLIIIFVLLVCVKKQIHLIKKQKGKGKKKCINAFLNMIHHWEVRKCINV